MLRLIIKEEGTQEELFVGNLLDLVDYLKSNENLYTWQLDEDPEIEMPDLSYVESLQELEYELRKVDLSWWALEVEEFK